MAFTLCILTENSIYVIVCAIFHIKLAHQQSMPITHETDLSTVPNPARTIQTISILTFILVVLLAMASFALSYEALAELAAGSGAISKGQAWAFPLCVDGAIVVFSIAALRATITGERGSWPLGLVVVSTLASVALNIAHAPGGFTSCLVGAMPPLLLFLAFESLMRQVAHNLRPAALKKRTPKRSALLKSPAESMKASPKSGAKNDRHERAKDLLRLGTPKRAISRELGLAVSTVRRLAVCLEAAA